MPLLAGPLLARLACSTLYDMRNALTIRLDPELEKLLDRLCRQTGRTRSELVRDALRRQLNLLRFEQLRRQVMPFAEARDLWRSLDYGVVGQGKEGGPPAAMARRAEAYLADPPAPPWDGVWVRRSK